MGKPKLKSSIKAFFNLRPLGPRTMTWVCVQQAKTDSFREVYKSFNSMYYTSSSTTSSSLCTTLNEEEADHRQARHMLPARDESFSASSSSLSTDSSDAHPLQPIPRGAISSQRFFFSPCTTKSIMEEATPSSQSEVEAEIDADEEATFLKRLFRETEEIKSEVGFCKESVTMAMASEDPYLDFRVSMEEMVEAHGLRDWSCLQELLDCYLRLNEKKTHKIIVLAFADLLMNLIEEENEDEEESLENLIPLRLCLEKSGS
ncbi:transcription repressor OFP13-like [Aristolochia californica]|uniref:transcription repressor OFP13-like n=1 Tax=Aristolochia californica TaxID=171875 RepID=UPI0035DE1066